MRLGTIYALCEPNRPDAVRYIGQTRTPPRTRLWAHINAAHKGRSHSAAWIRTLLARGEEPLMRVLETVSVDTLSQREMALIAEYRAAGVRLTNITDGGEGHAGVMPADVVAKIAAWHRGRSRSAETKRRLSVAMSGKKRGVRPESHRQSLRAAWEDPALRAAKSARMRELWADPDYRLRLMAKRAIQVPPDRKLTEAQVRDIKGALAGGAAIRPLARQFGVTPPNIRAIRDGVTWRWVEVRAA